jgi:hypothetical protein
MITVALPTWRNKDIIWLPLEGLCNQKTSHDWELIVMECPSDKETGDGYIDLYCDRLKEAGCKRIIYDYQPQRLPLGQKWKEIAKLAEGELFLLQGSDDYPHPYRIEYSANMIGDHNWYHERFGWWYSFISRKLLQYDMMLLKAWKTGNNMAMRTEAVRNIPDNDTPRGVDFFLFGLIEQGKSFINDRVMFGLNTNGLNTISLSRERHFSEPMPPFKKAYPALDEIGLPEDIVNRLQSTEARKLVGGEPITARVTRKLTNKYKPGAIVKINYQAFHDLMSKGYMDYAIPQEVTPYQTQLL